MDARLRALCDLMVPTARESVGRHEYDGVVQDLSPDGVRRALARLAPAGAHPYPDPHDEAQASAAEHAARVALGDLALHRANPLHHVGNLDLACYDREYAPAGWHAAARRAHPAAWPDAVDAAAEALDRVPAPVAAATLSAARGVAGQVRDDGGAAGRAALAAHGRLVAHLERAARDGHPETALGGTALAALLSSAEALPVDLTALAALADAERDRMRALLSEACDRIAPGVSTSDTVAALLADHPDIDGVLTEARALTAEVIAWTAERGLMPYDDGECRVGPAPESRRWAMAMMAWAAPYEADSPSWYHVTPPEPDWPAAEREEWLAVFSRTSLPAITVHEVAPGHFSHGRALRRAPSAVRRTLIGESFVEGWAHYAEEMALEEGFHADDPRFAAGVALEALVRVVRLSAAIGLHTGAMTVAEAAARFTADAYLQGPAALAEAYRGTFDPTYGRYTWGKLAILDLRERARRAWGAGFSLPRLHAALLALGSPPLGLLDTAVERG
ncbi:hypothetical protein GCM10022220_57380 [Actinocatenispora rupis]|uniref:DUF885 family protein n=1 Tax=Actinocatenispora rupis TaxID=519421 RepID=UPI0031ECA3BA